MESRGLSGNTVKSISNGVCLFTLSNIVHFVQYTLHSTFCIVFCEPYFLSYKNNLTRTQYHVLKGFAIKDKVYKVNGKEFMSSVGISNSSVINRTIASLLKSLFIYEDTDQHGRYYAMDNILFQKWIERQMAN